MGRKTILCLIVLLAIAWPLDRNTDQASLAESPEQLVTQLTNLPVLADQLGPRQIELTVPSVPQAEKSLTKSGARSKVKQPRPTQQLLASDKGGGDGCMACYPLCCDGWGICVPCKGR